MVLIKQNVKTQFNLPTPCLSAPSCDCCDSLNELSVLHAQLETQEEALVKTNADIKKLGWELNILKGARLASLILHTPKKATIPSSAGSIPPSRPNAFPFTTKKILEDVAPEGKPHFPSNVLRSKVQAACSGQVKAGFIPRPITHPVCVYFRSAQRGTIGQLCRCLLQFGALPSWAIILLSSIAMNTCEFVCHVPINDRLILRSCTLGSSTSRISDLLSR